jgi:hypothetical protein
MVLGLYGLGQFVTGLIAGNGALKFAGLAAFAGTTAAAILSGIRNMSGWLAPRCPLRCLRAGLMLMRREPSTTV